MFILKLCLPYLDYDVIVGGIANDKVFNTIELYLVAEIMLEYGLKEDIGPY